MIFLKKCKKCGELFDIEKCPYCRIKKEKEKDVNVHRVQR